MNTKKFRITKSWYLCPILEAEIDLEYSPQLYMYGKDEMKGDFLEENHDVYIVKILEINGNELYWIKAELLKELVEFIE